MYPGKCVWLRTTVVAVFGLLATALNLLPQTTVLIVSPTNASTVWGVTTVTASASDVNSGIAGVRFLLDGSSLGAEVTAPPFTNAWNTTRSAPGNHTLQAVARNGSSLTTTSSPVVVVVTAAPARLLKKSANGRYLVDQNSTPFLIAGDSPQSLMVNVSTNAADLYLANRQLRGFNALWVNLLCNEGNSGRTDASTYDGIVPFTGFLAGHAGDPNYYDLSKPNSNYFARCDWLIHQAAKYGLVIWLDPIETTGWLRNDGSNGVLLNNGTNAGRAYGQFLGNRYKNFTNIVWMCGNDFQNWTTPAADAVVTAVALGIKDTDSNHIHTVALDYPTSGSLNDTNWAPIISLNASYTYYPTYAQVLRDYNRTNSLPTFLIEANYEFEGLFNQPVTTAAILRRQEYWANLSGACGQFYGSEFTWRFTGNWQNFLDSPGALQMGNVKALFEPRPWYNLVPDQTHTVLTAGYGTYTNAGWVADNDYAVAARTPDGRLVIVYMPTLRTITVDMSQLSAPAEARWYDPSNGSYVSIAGSPFPNTGVRDFTPPGSNHDGDGDWVLLLEDASQTDSIGDGIPNWWRAQYFGGSGTTTDANSCASCDPDGDAMSNLQEFFTETNPTNANDVLRITGIQRLNSNTTVISFPSVLGRNYAMERSAGLPPVGWANVATNVPGTGGTIQITNTTTVSNPPQRYYRIKLLSP